MRIAQRRGGHVNVKVASDVGGVREQAVQLARSLCADAPLYGGHACLSCQSVALQLVARSAELGFSPALQPPPHGTNHRTCRSNWARLLAGLTTD